MNAHKLLIGLMIFGWMPEAFAFGSKPVPPPQPNPTPQGIQAIPFRLVELAHVTVPSFYLPNGTRADFNADLDKIFDTEINSSKHLRTQATTETQRSRLVMTGGITNFELDVVQLNVKIGWNQNGAIPIGTMPNVSGEVDLKLSSLSMDFKIYDRYTGQTYTADYTNESLSNLHLQVRLNLDNVVGSVDLLYKAKIAETLRHAMHDILSKIEAKQSFHLLPWEAFVAGIDTSKNQVVFNAGAIHDVKPNEIYSVYSKCDRRDANCFERFLADIRIVNTSVNNAYAVPNTEGDSIGNILFGDKVYVKPLASIQR